MSGRTGPNPKFARPLKDLAAMVGLSAETLRQNIDKGAPKPPKSTRGLTAWATKFHEWRRDNIGSFQDQQRAQAQARDREQGQHRRELEQWRAQEVKLRVAKETRQVVSRKEVVDFASRAILTVRARLNAMVMKMSSRLENVPSHVVTEELQQEVDDICDAFAKGMNQSVPSDD